MGFTHETDKAFIIEIREILKSVSSVIQTKEAIVKAHGVDLKLELKQAEESEFTITLPNKLRVLPF